ncbi:MAG: hypothetical protein ACKOW5_02595 [Actinomycetales bacterium]|jgi:hypothetical protein
MGRLIIFIIGVLTGVILARKGAQWVEQVRQQGVVESGRRLGSAAGRVVDAGRAVAAGAQGGTR